MFVTGFYRRVGQTSACSGYSARDGQGRMTRLDSRGSRRIRLISVLKRPASIVLTIAAVAAAAGLVAPAASAAPRTWTITKGGAVTAATKSFAIDDVTRNQSLPCKASTAKARLKSGRHLSGVGA